MQVNPNTHITFKKKKFSIDGTILPSSNHAARGCPTVLNAIYAYMHVGRLQLLTNPHGLR